MLNIALPKSACNLSKTGSPKPTGQLIMVQEILPPIVSPSLRIPSIKAIISSAVWASTHLTILLSLFSIKSATDLISIAGASIKPTLLTCAKTSIPFRCK